MAKPNILFIVNDQHRQNCLGCYGNVDVKTPALDAIAAEGTRYDNAFCNAPVCTPSRYSFLTGLYPHQNLAWRNGATLPAGISAFPQVLKEAGYRTSLVGKMHLTPTYQDLGFERMMLAEQCGDGRFEDDYHAYLREQGYVDAIDSMDQIEEYRERAPQEYWETRGAMECGLPEEHSKSAWIGRTACSEIEGWESDEGNFLCVGFINPHHPFDPPASWSEMYDPDELTLLPGWEEKPLAGDLAYDSGYFPHTELTETQLRKVMAFYYATISQIDHEIGQMVELLKQKGIYDNTIIIFTSDHGEFMGFHHLLLKANYMYEPLAKVPLLVKPACAGAEGRVEEKLTSLIDIATTVLGEGAPGSEAVNWMTGRNLLSNDPAPEFVFSEEMRAYAGRAVGNYMVRSERYKLLWNEAPEYCRFFDLESDPLELNDLFQDAAAQPEVARHREALLKHLSFTTSVAHCDLGARERPRTLESKYTNEQQQAWLKEEMQAYFEGGKS